MKNIIDRFLDYVKYDTQSEDDVEAFPSTKGQRVLLSHIAGELESIGLSDVSMDEYGYVFATLPSNIDKKVPTVGFISHVDTSPEISDSNVNPIITKNYDGNNIVLNKEENIILSTDEFPSIKKYKGHTIITTDGTTLLGADDKAGVAEIVTAMEYLVNHPEIKHGDVRVGFTPDEEVGRGVDFFNVQKFNADFAYTLDGGELGDLNYENFNAAKATITINGVSVHTGSAKNIMKNSVLIGNELLALLPQNETPSTTEGYEGFYHVDYFEGNVDKATIKYIIRDFHMDGLEAKKNKFIEIAEILNKKYGKDTVIIDIKDQYYNMADKIKENMYIIDTAKKAMESIGVAPKISPIRGGTDGSRLSYMGLLTPNLFTGGANFHGRYEYIPVSSMEKAVELIIKIIDIIYNDKK
jgi:tripeptide aminopeptidase